MKISVPQGAQGPQEGPSIIEVADIHPQLKENLGSVANLLKSGPDVEGGLSGIFNPPIKLSEWQRKKSEFLQLYPQFQPLANDWQQALQLNLRINNITLVGQANNVAHVMACNLLLAIRTFFRPKNKDIKGFRQPEDLETYNANFAKNRGQFHQLLSPKRRGFTVHLDEPSDGSQGSDGEIRVSRKGD